MNPTPQPKALELADWADMADKRYCMPKLHWCADELRRQHAEIEALRAEVERIGNNRDMWRGQCERQSAELERRQEDVMRMDWLSNIALSMDAVADPDNFTVVFFGTDPCKRAYGRTLRIAVDAAREAKE